MRRLIYIPIVHTMVDMGSKAEALEQEYIKCFGVERWVRRRRIIDEVWEGIREKLLALQLPWERVRIYQDGLPISGKELEIAIDVAGQGSKNYQVVLELVAKGARLEGTESPELLVREYTHVKRIAEASNEAQRQEAKRRYATEGQRLLQERDQFISRRIAETLKEGEVGLLFLGMMHEVDRILPKEIEVEFLIDRLPLGEGLGEGEEL